MSTGLDVAYEPRLGVDRLLIVGTGALTVSLLPGWIVWLRQSCPEMHVRILLTRTAEQFVSGMALRSLCGNPVVADAWDNGRAVPTHVELAEWAEAIAVFPASLHTVARFALGLADTPAMLTLQIARAPIGVAPALPPGAQHNPAVQQHLDALATRPNVVVAPLRPAPSAATGQLDTVGAGSLPELLALIECHRQRMRSEPEQSPVQ